MKILILEPLIGLSGDMFLSAGVDLGFDLDILNDLLQELKFKEIYLKKTKRRQGHLKGTFIKMPSNLPLLSPFEMCQQIEALDITDKVKKTATAIIKNLIKAERKIHGKKAHFDELSSLDTLIDALGAGLVLDWLKIEKSYISLVNIPYPHTYQLPYPLLAPATLELLRGFVLNYVNIAEEIVTPTGASIVKTICERERKIPEFIADKVSYGSGSKKIEGYSNMLRLITAETTDANYNDDIILAIETVIDDMKPLFLEDIMDSLYSRGALEVYFQPTYMKKNRIGFEIKVLTRYENKDRIIDYLLKDTTTLGLRYQTVQRKTLKRSFKSVVINGENLQLKVATEGGKVIKIAPEYEDCKKLAQKWNISVAKVYDIISEKVKSL